MVDTPLTFDERFELVLQATGCRTKADLAALLGVPPQNLNNWVNRGKRIGSDSRLLFQEKTGISVDWLNDGLGDMRLAPGSTRVEEPKGQYLRPLMLWGDPADLPPDQYVMLPALDYSLSAGCGGPDPDAVEASENGSAFRADFAAQERWSAKTHFTMRAKGDSMEPTIQNGAPVVIATNEKAVKSGSVYALLIDREPLLKRLDKLPGGRVRVRSDNTSNPAYAAFEVDADHVEIIGRAVWTPVRL